MNKILLSALAILFSTAVLANDYVLWNGGIGQEERATAPKQGVRLAFYEDPRPFIANVHVEIKDRGGQELVNMQVFGPWLILDLPSGSYSVVVQRQNGEKQSAIIDVDQTRFQEYAFRFAKAN